MEAVRSTNESVKHLKVQFVDQIYAKEKANVAIVKKNKELRLPVRKRCPLTRNKLNDISPTIFPVQDEEGRSSSLTMG